jgi:hypothetical protein
LTLEFLVEIRSGISNLIGLIHVMPVVHDKFYKKQTGIG